MLAGANTQAAAISVEVVISILYAGAVPAIPITIDSAIQSVQAASVVCVQDFSIKMRRKWYLSAHNIGFYGLY